MTLTVRVADVTKRYGRIAAVTGVSFDLGKGEMVALIGHNGAGKTTLIKLMLGLIRPTSGSIEVLGDNPAAGQFAGRRRLGYLPENVSLDAALTGRETQTFYAKLKREPVAKALELLDMVGLGTAGARRVGTYSKGMRQRLGLAQALIGQPRVLLLDEPTTGLEDEIPWGPFPHEFVRMLEDLGIIVKRLRHGHTWPNFDDPSGSSGLLQLLPP